MLIYTDGAPRTFPDPAQGAAEDSCFVFAPPKSGSVMLNALVTDLCRKSGRYAPVDIPSWLFSRGIPADDVAIDGLSDLFHAGGHAFVGYRSTPSWLPANLMQRSRRILLIRDPRDMLVSLFFSLSQSHPIPDEGTLSQRLERQRRETLEMGIERYVIGPASDWLLGALRSFADRVQGDGCLLIRYEDAIFSKRAMAWSISEHLSLGLDPEATDAAADRQDVFPSKEDPSQHVRRVTPGDHREKLSPAAIAQLDDKFAGVMELFQDPASA